VLLTAATGKAEQKSLFSAASRLSYQTMRDLAGSAACRVVARFRPQSAREGTGRCFKSLGEDTVAFSSPETSNNFTFDRIYGESSSQEELFQDVKPIVHAVLNGYNGTVLAYGQTGSGKTHTLLGDIEDVAQRGIVPRAIRELSSGISSCKTDCTFQASQTCQGTHDKAKPALMCAASMCR
ncbi:hypothetical protein MMC08_007957, partial [Hypocenomyce scalaris]|nr:hypothetical protein [Hypocenomyce scalaris]